MRFRSATLTLLALAALACDEGTVEPLPSYGATLSGANVIPPVTTTATGSASFTFEGSSVSFLLRASDITGITSATLHLGDATEENPPVVELFDDPTGTGTVNGTFGAGSFTGDALSGATLPQLMDAFDSGNAYVLVSTLAHADGELRGQVQPVPAALTDSRPSP